MTSLFGSSRIKLPFEVESIILTKSRLSLSGSKSFITVLKITVVFTSVNTISSIAIGGSLLSIIMTT